MRLFLAAMIAVSAPASAEKEFEAVTTSENTMQNVVVQPGDTLWSISHRYLKDPTKWDEILKNNKLPSSDPTVALPGMVLHIPVRLIKTSLRAAYLVYMVNQVLYRRKDTPEWKSTTMNQELFQGDSLRTLDESKARVKFLNKELLNLDPNSMAVIKPANVDADVELKNGSVFAGRARVITANARVTPRTLDTRYSASIEPDLTTKIEVFKGLAAVDAQGRRVEVPAGMETRVSPGLAPEVPRPLSNPTDLESRAREFASAAESGGGIALNPKGISAALPEADADTLRQDISSTHIGVPILGYHVQASTDRDFAKIVFDRKYDADDRFSAADAHLSPGAYWWRTAIIDLLGTEGRYDPPRYYSVGIKHAAAATVDIARSVTLASPIDGATLSDERISVTGIVRDERLTVSVNGQPARVDSDGNFSVSVSLKRGVNEIEVLVSDGKGNQNRLSRRVTRQ